MNLLLIYFSVLALSISTSDTFHVIVERQEGTTAAAAAGEGGAAAGAAAGGKPVKCVKCKSYEDCGTSIENTMDCLTEGIADIGLDGDEKTLFDSITESNPTSFAKGATKYCVTVQWKNAEFRGCAPQEANDKENKSVDVCEAIKTFGDDIECTACEATEDAGCNNDKALKSKNAGFDLTPNFSILSICSCAVLFKLLL